MKKTISVIMAILLVLSIGVIGAFAEEPVSELSAAVYVTIADQDGITRLAAQTVVVSDTDSDGALTVNDALYCAHEQFYEGGAAAGYATESTQYGLSLKKLWGSANGGSYGYYVNNASAWSLTDPIKGGDYLAAFCYTDLVGWSDHYSFFDKRSGNLTATEEFTLTYSEAGYDELWNPVTLPVAGAEITVDGEATGITTDAEGKCTLVMNDLNNLFIDYGPHLISATVAGKTLVKPVFVADIVKPETIFVTIADQEGKTVLAAESILVTDADHDGVLTVNDALYCAHEMFYEGGAAAGYATKSTQYGLSLDKLWGSANGGSYGYYVNNASAWSLTDPIKGGDYLAAFCYTDLVGWSDHYSFFDKRSGNLTATEEFTLTYSEAGYDELWNPVTLPVAGAEITVDGEATGITTDAGGKATVSISEPGKHIVSATVDGKRLVAPVFIAYIRSTDTYKKGDADMDGNITILDATRIQRFIAELIGEDEIDLFSADADGDGEVTILDATHIQRFIAELIKEL